MALVLACALVPGLHPLLLPLHISSDLLPILQQESVAVVVSSKPDQIALPGIQVLPSNLENLTASQLPESASPDVHQSAISISVHHQGQWSLVDLNHLVRLFPVCSCDSIADDTASSEYHSCHVYPRPHTNLAKQTSD